MVNLKILLYYIIESIYPSYNYLIYNKLQLILRQQVELSIAIADCTSLPIDSSDVTDINIDIVNHCNELTKLLESK